MCVRARVNNILWAQELRATETRQMQQLEKRCEHLRQQLWSQVRAARACVCAHVWERASVRAEGVREA